MQQKNKDGTKTYGEGLEVRKGCGGCVVAEALLVKGWRCRLNILLCFGVEVVEVTRSGSVKGVEGRSLRLFMEVLGEYYGDVGWSDASRGGVEEVHSHGDEVFGNEFYAENGSLFVLLQDEKKYKKNHMVVLTSFVWESGRRVTMVYVRWNGG